MFRTSFTQTTAMPKLARYIKNTVKAKSVAIVWVNNDFGKGGRDSMAKALEAEGIKVAADISTDPGQVDFSAAVLKVKQSNADAVFVYTNEEESARALRELKKQGYDKPIIGETTLTGQKVIELAGDAANGAVAHVGLTVDAPQPQIKAFDQKFQAEYKYKSDHNGMKGYSGMYVVKAITEKIGKFDGKEFAKAMHGATIHVKDYPGVLLDVHFDNNGDLDRESFLVKVEGGKQVVTQTPASDSAHNSRTRTRTRPSRRRRPHRALDDQLGRRRWLTCCSSLSREPPPARSTRSAPLGFTLLWQASGTINFAQGEFVMVPAFMMLFFINTAGLPMWLAFLLTCLVAMVLLGYTFKRAMVDPLIRHGVIPLVIATLGLSIGVKQLVKAGVTAQAQPFNSIFPDGLLSLGALKVSYMDVGTLVLAGVIVVSLQMFLNRTVTGRAMQAVAQNTDAAKVLGIMSRAWCSTLFLINAVLAVVAALLVTPTYLAKFDMGESIGLKAFYAAIIGGFNQTRGALLGGVLVGVLENLTGAYISPAYKEGVALMLFLVVIIFKPEGLLGKTEERKV